MTCIVGVIEDGKIYIGADSAGSNSQYQLTVLKSKKLFRRGEFLIGGTGEIRMLQLLQYSFQPPQRETDDIMCYMATTFVDAVRECFKAGGFAYKSSEQESHSGEFLVGYQGRLFSIQSNYQVVESLHDYNAVGCGNDIALGVLFATPDTQATKRIELALKASEYHNIGVRAPFYIETLEPNKEQ